MKQELYRSLDTAREYWSKLENGLHERVDVFSHAVQSGRAEFSEVDVERLKALSQAQRAESHMAKESVDRVASLSSKVIELLRVNAGLKAELQRVKTLVEAIQGHRDLEQADIPSVNASQAYGTEGDMYLSEDAPLHSSAQGRSRMGSLAMSAHPPSEERSPLGTEGQGRGITRSMRVSDGEFSGGDTGLDDLGGDGDLDGGLEELGEMSDPVDVDDDVLLNTGLPDDALADDDM
ncbi:hypothetical protein KIPB_009742 [Kipferlia bialata]|uniref:Uncharacterized protein n=1 Tax=Kipferlia bialata TaxID=797122 RepID=A0A9K3GLV5_9EUKA|nr:hypothetical protein KIPB_009742 [Kipferlia bialata]|eukprot:g9742.t1